MALPTCPDCGSSDLDRGADHADGRWYVFCLDCEHEWLRGEARPVPPGPSIENARRRFPTRTDAASADLTRTDALKQQFLETRPAPLERVAPFWSTYQEVFSSDGLPTCDPQLLKDFANSSVGANPGNMSVFNTAWHAMGVKDAAAATRASIEHLLRGPGAREDRLTDLILGVNGAGMTGFRESLLTKVLCVTEPERFIPICIYTSRAGVGKREIAASLYGVRLPAPEATTWTKGRLIHWGNDLLRELAGDGFVDGVHVAEFVWWASQEAAGV